MGMKIAGGLKAGLVVAAIGAFAAPAFADGVDRKGSLKDAPVEEPKREWALSGSIGVSSEYVFRGFSQSAENPAVSGAVDLTYRWFYAGIAMSMIDFGEDAIRPGQDIAHVEVDYYLGIKPVVGPVTFDVGVIYYTYPNAFDPGGAAAFRELDFVEVKFGASGSPWRDASLGLTVYYTPEYTNETGEVWTVEGTFSQGFAAIRDITPSISGTLGYQTGDDIRYNALVANGSDNYLYWNIGVGLAFGERFSLDFRYWDTDVANSSAALGTDGFCTGRTFQCDERFVATAKITY